MSTQQTAFTLEPATRKSLNSKDPDTRAAALEQIRRDLGIPAGGHELRAWIRYNLQLVTHPKTGRPWTQADVGRLAGESSPTRVSRTLLGGFSRGRRAIRIREVVAEVLGLPVDAVFPPAPACDKCGQPLPVADDETSNVSR